MMLNPLTDATRGAVAQAIAVLCHAAAGAAERVTRAKYSRCRRSRRGRPRRRAQEKPAIDARAARSDNWRLRAIACKEVSDASLPGRAPALGRDVPYEQPGDGAGPRSAHEAGERGAEP